MGSSGARRSQWQAHSSARVIERRHDAARVRAGRTNARRRHARRRHARRRSTRVRLRLHCRGRGRALEAGRAVWDSSGFTGQCGLLLARHGLDERAWWGSCCGRAWQAGRKQAIVRAGSRKQQGKRGRAAACLKAQQLLLQLGALAAGACELRALRRELAFHAGHCGEAEASNVNPGWCSKGQAAPYRSPVAVQRLHRTNYGVPGRKESARGAGLR